MAELRRRLTWKQRYANPKLRLEYYKRRYRGAFNTALLWAQLLETAQYYISPNRNMFWIPNAVQGQSKNRYIYDTTQVHACDIGVKRLQQSLTPPGQRWGSLAAGSFVPENEKDNVNEQLDQKNEVLYSAYRNSNFDIVATSFYRDLYIGTGIITANPCNKETRPVVYGSLPLGRIAIEESINGTAQTIFCTRGALMVMDVQEKWPDAKLPAEALEAFEEDPCARINDLVDAQVYVDGEEFPFKYVVWSGDDILLEAEWRHARWICVRWDTLFNEAWGRGPGINVLPSVLSLQRLAYLELTAAEQKASRTYMGWDDGVFNPKDFAITPMSVIPIKPNTPANMMPIQVLPTAEDPSFKQMTTLDLRAQINAMMYANPLGAIDETPQKTATEIAVREKSYLEQIGPTATRLQHEFLEPLTQATLDILEEKALTPRIQIDGRVIEIRYQSPLVLAQGVQDVDNVLGANARIAAVYGDMSAQFWDAKELVPWIGKQMAIKHGLLYNGDQLEKIFAAQAQQAQELQQAALAQSQPKAAPQAMAA